MGPERAVHLGPAEDPGLVLHLLAAVLSSGQAGPPQGRGGVIWAASVL